MHYVHIEVYCYCKSSVRLFGCLPVLCDVEVSLPYRLGYLKSNYTDNWLRDFAPRSPNIGNLVQWEHPKIRVE